ncbi:MAG: protein-L-isoaspartate(D-aspartate) O-methyltransferase [Anaerolineae bacterium]
MRQVDFDALRENMIQEHLIARGIHDEQVIAAFRAVPRHAFVPEEQRHLSYEDHPLLIGQNQTISQPYIVAYMLECLGLKGSERVLEIGTGSGYLTALLARLGHEIFTVERHESLLREAQKVLVDLGIENVRYFLGDGTLGVPSFAPYQAEIVSAAAPKLPPTLVQQLDEGGRLVIPIKTPNKPREQMLWRISRRNNKPIFEKLMAVAFVPLIGAYGYTSEE